MMHNYIGFKAATKRFFPIPVHFWPCELLKIETLYSHHSGEACTSKGILRLLPNNSRDSFKSKLNGDINLQLKFFCHEIATVQKLSRCWPGMQLYAYGEITENYSFPHNIAYGDLGEGPHQLSIKDLHSFEYTVFDGISTVATLISSSKEFDE